LGGKAAGQGNRVNEKGQRKPSEKDGQEANKTSNRESKGGV